MANNTVKLAVYGRPCVELEGALAAAVPADTVLPGFLMERIDNGSGVAVYRPHSVAEGAAAKLFAVENFYFGKGVTDYYKPSATPTDIKVYMIYARPGDVVWCMLSASQTITVGTYLYSSGTGRVRAAAGVPVAGGLIGSALDAVTTGVGEYKRVKVEIV